MKLIAIFGFTIFCGQLLDFVKGQTEKEETIKLGDYSGRSTSLDQDITIGGHGEGAMVALNHYLAYNRNFKGCQLFHPPMYFTMKLKGQPLAADSNTNFKRYQNANYDLQDIIGYYIRLGDKGEVDGAKCLRDKRHYIYFGRNTTKETGSQFYQPKFSKDLSTFFKTFSDNVLYVQDKAIGAQVAMPDCCATLGKAQHTCEDPKKTGCTPIAGHGIWFESLDFLFDGRLELGNFTSNIDCQNDKIEGLYLFDQKEFVDKFNTGKPAFAAKGFIYIPKRCKTSNCKKHFSHHACRPKYDYTTVRNEIACSSALRVAEKNNIVIIFPIGQGNKGWKRHCLDWYGRNGKAFGRRSDVTNSILQAMYNRIAGIDKKK